MEAKHAQPAPKSWTEPAHEPPAPITKAQAIATVRDVLGASVIGDYHHHPDGGVLDTRTGELLDRIPD